MVIVDNNGPGIEIAELPTTRPLYKRNDLGTIIARWNDDHRKWDNVQTISGRYICDKTITAFLPPKRRRFGSSRFSLLSRVLANRASLRQQGFCAGLIGTLTTPGAVLLYAGVDGIQHGLKAPVKALAAIPGSLKTLVSCEIPPDTADRLWKGIITPISEFYRGIGSLVVALPSAALATLSPSWALQVVDSLSIAPREKQPPAYIRTIRDVITDEMPTPQG